MTNRFAVSKSHPAIKAILAATFPNWKGRQVAVIEADDRDPRGRQAERGAQAHMELVDRHGGLLAIRKDAWRRFTEVAP